MQEENDLQLRFIITANQAFNEFGNGFAPKSFPIKTARLARQVARDVMDRRIAENDGYRLMREFGLEEYNKINSPFD